MNFIPLLCLPLNFQGQHCKASRSVSEKVDFGGAFSSSADLALFRWIIGHQTLALAMKLASLEMQALRVAESTEEQQKRRSRILRYIETFAALLHYTVSWSPETYLQSIRPSMMAIHPSFSGLWWAEVTEFKSLLNQLSETCPNEYRVIAKGYGAFWQQHSVLKKYLPVDSSLYREGQHTLTPDFDYSDYFDLYFKIVRREGCEDIFLEQLNTRVRLIKEDVEIHGLFADSPLTPITTEAFLQRQNELLDDAERTFADAVRTVPPKQFRPDHLAVQVRDVNQTVKWYEAFFEARVAWRMDGGFSETTTSRLPTIRSLVELQIGAITFHIFDSDVSDTCPPATAHPNYQHFGIEVPTQRELNEMRQRWFTLRSRTEEFSNDYILPTDIITENDGTQLFYCTDPNGLEFEIIHRPLS